MQESIDSKLQQCNSVARKIVYHGCGWWMLGQFLLTSHWNWIVSTFYNHVSKSSLSLAILAVIMFFVFPAVSLADSFIPALSCSFYKSLPSRSAAWMCWCVWAKILFSASNAILSLHSFPLHLWQHSSYVLPLIFFPGIF